MKHNAIPIPSSFFLHGQEYTVKTQESMTTKEGKMGEFRPGFNEICLQPPSKAVPYPPSQVEQTFLHELVHGILYHMESKKGNDEAFVNQFANLLHQALTTAEYGKGASIDELRRMDERAP